MRHKDYGIWQTWTWERLRDEVRAFAVGLRKLGIERGDAVAIIGDNRPRLYATFAAVQSVGGIAVPVYQDSVADGDGLRARTRRGEVRRRRRTRSRSTRSSPSPIGCRSSSKIIYDEERGLDAYDHANLHSFEHVQDLGREEMRRNAGAAGWWLDEIAKGKGADVSVMLYTSGTTGRPKGVMLTHDNIVVSGAERQQVRQLHARRHAARLPADGLGRRPHLLLRPGLRRRPCACACPESPETIIEDRREIAPTYFFAPPRVFENLLTQIMVRMEDAGRIKKAMFDYFLGVARRCGEQILDGKPVGAKDRLLYRLGDSSCTPRSRNRMGFSKHPRGLHGRRGDRAGAVPLLSLARHQPEAALRADRSQRLHHAAARRRGVLRHGRQARPRRRDQDRRQRRGAVQEPRRVPQVLQERRGHRRGQDAGRLGAYGRCRLLRPARPPQDHRSRQGRRPPQQRRAVRAEVPREPHQVLSRGARGGRLRPRPRLRDDVHQHRPDLGRQLGRAQQRVLRQLPGAGRASAGLRDRRQARGRAEQGAGRRAADGGLAGPPLPDPAQGARRRRRRADAHAEGAPLVHRRPLRAADQGALRRLEGVPHRHRGDLRGRPQGHRWRATSGSST